MYEKIIIYTVTLKVSTSLIIVLPRGWEVLGCNLRKGKQERAHNKFSLKGQIYLSSKRSNSPAGSCCC